MRSLLVPAAILLFGASCAHAPPRPVVEVVPGQLLTAELEPFSEAELLVLAPQIRYLLIGERHDSRCDHRVQAELVRLLGGAGDWAVGLEMVDVEKVEVLERFSAKELSLAGLAEALEWELRWGVDFDDYEPIFAAAELTGSPVAPLNLPRLVLGALARGEADAIPAELHSLIVPEAEVIGAPEEQLAFLREAYEGHAHGAGNEERWQRFVYVQSLWDSQMAWRAVQLNRDLGRQVIVIAGAGHVWNGWGIAHRLRAYDPGGEILSLVAWRGGEPPDPASSDLFFYCPAPGAEEE